PYTDGNPQKCFYVAIADNRQKVGNGRSAAVRLYLSCCSYWRSLGETADDFRNADKSERNRITCWLSDTTGGYHQQRVAYEFPLTTGVALPAPLKGNGKAERDRSIPPACRAAPSPPSDRAFRSLR